ncbi:serine hydrolase domain-containing protein [Phenylobacterium sp.]|uniref:serine hydrolase domain-containing protein n=1 Tax=Phenylobacterium sp. TaxID=1871053 RepID=UPI00301C8197
MSDRTHRRAFLAAVAATAAGPALAGGSDGVDPEWTMQPPTEAGFDAERLTTAIETAMARRSRAVLALRGGRIVAERYAPGWGVERSLEVASVGKSMLAVLTGMALDDGHLRGLDQAVADFAPEWRDGPRAAITLRHLLSMTSGLDDTGLALRNIVGDQYALNIAAPLKAAPGTTWRYNTAAYHLLFHILARATGQPFEAYARRRLLDPLGLSHTTWLTNPGRGSAGTVTNYYTAVSSARDLARFGLFARQGGVWRGRRLVAPAFIEAMISPSQALNPAYGLLWWVNSRPGVDAQGRHPGLRFPGSPPDAFAALGAGGQAVMVVPSRDLVVVRQGDPPGSEAMLPELLAGVVGALKA